MNFNYIMQSVIFYSGTLRDVGKDDLCLFSTKQIVSQFFQLSTCEYQLRGHAMKLSKQRTSLDVRKFSFSQRVVQEWNKLSQDVVEATSVNQFKNRWDKFWQRYGQ